VAPAGERQVDVGGRAVRVEDRQPPAVDDGDPTAGEVDVGGHPELPQRDAALLLHRPQLVQAVRPDPDEVPPPGPVGDRPDGGAVPRRRLHRLLRSAEQDLHLAQCGTGQQVGDAQLGAVPGHARVVPGDEGQARAVRGDGRCGDEVRPRPQHGDLPRAVERHGDELVHDVLADPLAHAQHVRPCGKHHRLGVPVGPPGVGGERPRLAVLVDEPQALVVQVAGEQATRVRDPAPAAVLVHAGAGVELGRQHLLDRSVAGPAQDGGATVLRRPRRAPPHRAAAAGDGDVAVLRGGPGDLLGGERTRPGAARQGRHVVGHALLTGHGGQRGTGVGQS
jgi:hypothetical protein